MGSFAGLSLTVMPWLLSGGTLSLHHGFDADAFTAQCRDDRCDTVVVPGAVVPQLAEAGLLAHDELKNVLAVWRDARAAHGEPSLEGPRQTLTDILIFGEIGLIGSRRGSDGCLCSLPAGIADAAPRGSCAVPIAESRGPTKARWRCAERWCRAIPSRPAAARWVRTAPQGRRRRLRRYGLSLPDRSDGGHCHGNRPACRASSAWAAIALF